MLSTHLPGQDAKRVHVTCWGSSGVGQPGASRVNQFRGSAVKEPINIYPWHDG